MALYKNITLTQKGQELLSQIILSSDSLVISSVAIGNGELSAEDIPENFEALKNEVIRLPIQQVTKTTGGILIEANLSTASIQKDIVQKEIGIFSGLDLIAYGNTGASYDFIPAAGQNTAVTKTISIKIAISAGNVIIEPLDSSAFVTQAQINETIPKQIQSEIKKIIDEGGEFKVTADPATDNTHGTVKLAKGQTSSTLAAVASSGSFYDLEDTPPVNTMVQLLSSSTPKNESRTGNLYYVYKNSSSDETLAIEFCAISMGTDSYWRWQAGDGAFRNGSILQVGKSQAIIAFYVDGQASSMISLSPAGINLKAETILANGKETGLDGASAYQIWLDHGNTGSEEDFLAALVGPQGESATDEQIETIVTSEIYDQKETQTRTTQGTDNYNASWFMLDAQHVPTGTLTAISIPCRTNSTGANITYDPVYLTLQIQSASGGDNWEPLAVSTNTVVQAINTTGIWEFDNVPLDGRDVRACLNTAPTGEWNTGLTMGLRVSSRPAGDTTSNVGGAAYLADVTLTTVIYTEKFTSADHATDSTIHITDAERQRWNAKADASDLGTKVNSSTFTAHTGDTVAHLTTGEHTALTELIENGGGGTITIDDTPTEGSDNAVSSGGVYDCLNSYNVAIGLFSGPLPPSYNCSVAVGASAYATGFASTAVGVEAKSRADSSVALGVAATAEAESSCALGAGGYIADTGVTVLNAGGEITDGKSTQLYLIPAGSDMANTYTNGNAGLGYVVLDHLSGSVVARGTIPLASICTQHTSNFSPTGVTSIKDY